MVNHTETYLNKKKEQEKQREIDKKIRQEEKRLKRELTYQRKLKKKRDDYKAFKETREYQSYLDYQRQYRLKQKQKKQEDRQEKIDSILKGKSWRLYEGYYVTDQGEIYDKWGKKLKGYKRSSGYKYHSINYKGKLEHRIVWEAFFGEIPDNMEIDHINTKRDDNRLDNLRLVTHQQNCNNPSTLTNYSRGNTTGHCRPIIQVYDDNTIKEWTSAAEAARNGYTQASIWAACNGKIKKHSNCKWYYKNEFINLI